MRKDYKDVRLFKNYLLLVFALRTCDCFNDMISGEVTSIEVPSHFPWRTIQVGKHTSSGQSLHKLPADNIYYIRRLISTRVVFLSHHL